MRHVSGHRRSKTVVFSTMQITYSQDVSYALAGVGPGIKCMGPFADQVIQLGIQAACQAYEATYS